MPFSRNAEIQIEASPEAVYDYLSDVTRHGEWSAARLVVQLDRPEAGVTSGATFTSHARLVGDVAATGQVITVDRPREFVYECLDRTGRNRWTMRMQPVGGGTLLSYGVERPEAPLWVRLTQEWLLWPLFGRSGAYRALLNIKQRLEETP